MADAQVAGPAGQLHVSDGGAGGPAIVLVHGLTGHVGYWQAQLDHLRRGRRAVALDLRGHGASERAADGDYTIDGFVADVEAIVNALALPTFVLAGHSFGAAVAGEYAGRHPDRVRGLLLGDPAGDMTRYPQDEIAAFRAALRSDAYAQVVEESFSHALAQADPGVREHVLASLRATPREVVVGAYDTLLAYDPRPALERYRQFAGGPMLAVTTDLNVGPLALHEQLPGLPWRAMTGTSHWLMMDRPVEFNALLDEFLASVGS